MKTGLFRFFIIVISIFIFLSFFPISLNCLIITKSISTLIEILKELFEMIDFVKVMWYHAKKYARYQVLDNDDFNIKE